MRKILAILIAASMLMLVSCGSDKPEDVVRDYLSAAKSFDMEKLQGYMASPNDLGDSLEGENDVINDFFKQCAAKISYNIQEVKVDGDKAEVLVDVDYRDASEFMSRVMSDYITKAFALFFSGGDSSEDAAQKLFLEVFEEDLKDAEFGTANSQVSFSLEKIDGKWKIIEVGDEFIAVMTANSLDAMSDLF